MNKDSDHLKAVNQKSHKDNVPVLLRQVKDNTISIMLAHLENLFGSCDDLFFDLSSRAASNSEQNLYFESMREVRLKKNGVISAFKSEIESGFHTISDPIQAAASNTATPQDDTNQNNLSLVHNDALEQDVAISSMVKKARVNCQESLYHLNLRCDYLIPHSSITPQNNPLDPQQLCNYFAEACKLLELNIKARIILFKQFDRIVVAKLATAYSSANSLLIEAGVLPNTESYKQTRGNNRPQRGSSPSPDNQSSQLNFERDLSELSSLLDNIRQQPPEVMASLIPNYRSYANNPGPAIANNDLLHLLTLIQQSMAPPVNDEAALQENIRRIVSDILSNKGSEPERSVEQPDDDTINLVAMFFDFVLDDKNLPVPVQALISRLQIPVLKIALKDKSFFSNSNHPARQFINAIAEASIGWDDASQPQKDKLYSLISKHTQEINDHFADNEQIFSQKLTEIQDYVAQTEHKSELIAKRTSQTAEGQAKTKLAKLMSQNVMYEKLQTNALPDAISEFLTNHWLNLLIMTHLKYSDESPQWIESTQLIDDIIWASQNHKDAKSLERLEKIKPDLLKRINEGMNKIANTREAAAEVVETIEKNLNDIQADRAESLMFRPMSAEQAKDLGHTPGGGSKAWKEMTGVERQQARYKQLTYDFIRKAEQLPLNTWLSYTDQKTGKITRCKLTAKIEQSDSYIFVNRFGFKALEKTRKDFAYDIQIGNAVVLEQGQLFDRAMSNIFTGLSNTDRIKNSD
jgi:hypothetical protein